MKYLRMLPLAALLACAHVVPVAMCAEPLVVQIIENDFSSPDWASKIEEDAAKYGPSVIECVVNQIIAQAEGATSESSKVEHAKAWKAAH
jgi:hypothetical protein